MKKQPGAERTWQRLIHAAQEEVETTLGALPERLQREARRIPVTLEPRPSPALIEEDIEPDTLGLFVGDEMADRGGGEQPLPSQVILFLENIWEYAGHDASIYREEVRRTLLHELGHYLGLDESDLESRDLD